MITAATIMPPLRSAAMDRLLLLGAPKAFGRGHVIALAIFAASALPGLAEADQVIAVVGPMTGLQSATGIDITGGVELAVSDINAKGGSSGRSSHTARSMTLAIRTRPKRRHNRSFRSCRRSSSAMPARPVTSGRPRSMPRRTSCR